VVRGAGAVGDTTAVVWVGPSAGNDTACQRSKVRGDTSRSWCSCVGSSLLSELSNARSGRVSAGASVVWAQHGDLVTQHQDLDILERATTRSRQRLKASDSPH
jgi:hypothetical protein